MRAAVLWDFDGTLASRTGMWSGALIEALDAHAPGHGLEPDDVRPALRSGFPWHTPELERAPESALQWWDAMMPVFVAAYRAAGVPDAEARSAAGLVPHHYYARDRWRLEPGATDALELLRDAGVGSVVVSNHGPELPALVAELGLVADAVITSAAVGVEKPHPRIFGLALERAGHPARVWMVGDNAIADIAGAAAVGIPGILIDGSTGPLDAAEHILASFR